MLLPIIDFFFLLTEIDPDRIVSDYIVGNACFPCYYTFNNNVIIIPLNPGPEFRFMIYGRKLIRVIAEKYSE